MRRFANSGVAVLLSFLCTSAATAAVTRFEITQREPFAGGKIFGSVGTYEKIVGRVHFAVDPALKQNQAIVDLSHAPKNAKGLVEFSGDLFILAPKDMAKGNGAILYDVNNRGNKLALRFFNNAGGNNDASDAGDGFLMRNGFTVVWSGWDGELLPEGGRMRLAAPVASNNGQPITGPVRCEVVPTSNTNKMLVVNWDSHGSYRPTPQGLETATLSIRERPLDPRVTVPRSDWKLHVTDVAPGNPSQLPKVELEVTGGMKMGFIYELIYEAQDPLVHGVCFASVRDLISALRHGLGQDNPISSASNQPLKRANGFGVSQSGRFLREFLYTGFNEDEQGRKVFDGLIPHVSGSGLGSFNHRFAQPTRHCQQHDHHDYPADRFPFAYETQHDPISGKTDGILQRAAANGTMPYVLHTQSAGEYWTRSGSLSHTDPLGKVDASVPPNVRVFLFGGTQHGPAAYPPSAGPAKHLANPGDYKPYLRALLLALDRWSRDSVPAPASVYPTIKNGTLVAWTQSATNFPAVPGVKFPTVIQQPAYLDFGPRWESERIADIQPPRLGASYTVLVPKCGPDGNEIDCLSPPEVAVPLATYTGWNLRKKESGAEDELVSLTGAYIPLPVTKAERQSSGDPRLSLEERYGTLDGYLKLLTNHCRQLETTGYLLAEDSERIIKLQTDRAKPLFEKIK